MQRLQFALCAAVSLLIAHRVGSAAETSPTPAAGRISVLFLGDAGHHRPAERARQLVPILAGRGIDVTYTQNVADLNRDSLARYDALAVYANIERISPEQEAALLGYVDRGGGLVALHCASFCFVNSPRYTALVGAQFASHDTGEFNTVVVDAGHPIMQGLKPFNTWDETYRHRLHNEQDRTVLQVRVDAQGREPWTWVRTPGEGRVFYTAYGHDARTWGEPGFQALVERGIRWASRRGEVFDSTPKLPTGLPAPKFTKATLPNYVPSTKWGTQGDPLGEMPEPLSPAESQLRMVVSSGFEVQLFAAEPDVVRPIAMTWDHRGRLWVAESVDYPNELQPPGQGRDRIKICEDTDGDGRADKFTVFADKLSLPTSLLCARGGVIVHQPPETLFLRDTDGDDRADERQVLLSGWKTNDTHAGPSNLRYGFDNWLYGMVGYAGFKGEVGGEAHDFRTGFMRFRPDGSKLEFLRSTNNNSWGVGISEDGQLFGSTANGCPSVWLGIANRYYESVRGWSPGSLESIAAWNRYYPVTDKVRQVDWHGGFTAAAGHALYTARTYPRHYWNRAAFVTDPTGHLAATFLIEPRGADYVSHNSWNLLASFDEWTAPIAAEVGPDGQVWIIDWYNYIVQHNPTPHGFKTGKGNAYETDLRDKTHGRIYRVVHKQGRPSPIKSLDPADPRGLVAALGSDNLFWRLTAQRLLVERGQRDVADDLVKLVDSEQVDELGLSPAAMHALWTLSGLGVLADESSAAWRAAVGALKHPSVAMRRQTVQAIPPTDAALAAILTSNVLTDPDPQVRLATLLAVSTMPNAKSAHADAAARAIVDFLSRPENLSDRWLTEAATIAAARFDARVLQQIAAQWKDKLTPGQDAALRRVAEHFARRAAADDLPALVAALPDASVGVGDAIMHGLAAGWPRDRPVKLDAAAETALAKLLEQSTPQVQAALVSLAGRWQSETLASRAGQIASALQAVIRDSMRDDAARVEAARQIIALRADDAALAVDLVKSIAPDMPDDLSVGLLQALSLSEAKEVGPVLVGLAPALPSVPRAAAVKTLLARAAWVEALLAAAEAGQFDLGSLALDQKQGLTTHADARLAERAKKLLASGGGLPDANRQQVIEELSPKVLAGGDPQRGQQVFAAQCGKCHTHSGAGGKVGPDLTGMAVHPREELLVQILDPSRSVEGNFLQYTAVVDDGRSLVGLLASRTKTSIELVDAEGKRHPLLRENVDQLVASRKSLMPEGFEKQLPVESIADLLAFLTKRGKYLPLDLRKVATIVSTRGMFYDAGADAERLIFADWSPKTVSDVPFVLVDPQGEQVNNVILLYGPQGKFPPTMPKSVTLACNAPARRIHLLSGVSGWGYGGGEPPRTVSLIVRLHYADGASEDHPLENGVHFADYIRQVDVPGSQFAFKLRDQQIRYLSIEPRRAETIATIELVKGPDATAPVVMAVTVEGAE